jgi:3',5'-cyclic AMP phosphodiesterase CpdA
MTPTRIAHLSDLHLNGSIIRRTKLANACVRAGPISHLVLTGDLTANGSMTQFEELAQVLASCPTKGVTITPGNHDGGPGRWKKVIEGPLSRFRATSAPGAYAVYPDVVIVAVNTQIDQLPILARGRVSREQLDIIRSVATAYAHLPVVVAMHHGPQDHPFSFLENLANRDEMLRLLVAYPNVFVLAGHDHRCLDIGGRIFTAGACAESKEPLRMYDVKDGKIVPAYRGERGHVSFL